MSRSGGVRIESDQREMEGELERQPMATRACEKEREGKRENHTQETTLTWKQRKSKLSNKSRGRSGSLS